MRRAAEKHKMTELVAKAQQDALRTYEDHAAKGDANGAYNCPIMYARGVGTARDRGMALRYLEDAAEGGLAPAQSQLAFLYSTGRGGLGGRDSALALEWYEKAASQGDAEGLYQRGAASAHFLGERRLRFRGARRYSRR